MIITWKRYLTYEDACDCTGVIYLHEWDGEPFYWGIAYKSFFGGSPRINEESIRSGRYSISYRHWIEGCLQHGAKLYIGTLNPKPETLEHIKAVESQLISTYPSEMNQLKPVFKRIDIIHRGDVPNSISITYPPTTQPGE